MSHKGVPHNGLCRRGMSLLQTELGNARLRLRENREQVQEKAAGSVESMAARAVESFLAIFGVNLQENWPVADKLRISVTSAGSVHVTWEGGEGVEMSMKLPGEYTLSDEHRSELEHFEHVELQLSKIELMKDALVEDLLIDTQLFEAEDKVATLYYQRLREAVQHVEEFGELKRLEAPA